MRKSEIVAKAFELGLDIDVYSPGDETTRYLISDGGMGECVCIGAREVELYLAGAQAMARKRDRGEAGR